MSSRHPPADPGARNTNTTEMPKERMMPADHPRPPSGNGDEPPLPAPNVRCRRSGSTGEFTAEEVRGCLANPVYAGLGPFPQLVPEAQWVGAAAWGIRADGPEQFLVNLLFVLRQSLAGLTPEQ
jgi:hypothetical protein